MAEDLEATVKGLIAEELGVDVARCADGAQLADDLSADSLDRLNLTIALESKYGFDIPDEEADKLVVVGDVVKYVKARILETL